MSFDPSTIQGLTPAEWRELIEYAAEQQSRQQAAEAASAASSRERIARSVARLEALLGPADAGPYDPGSDTPATIRGVARHTPEVLGQYAGVVLDLVVDGMEILADTLRDVASVVGEQGRS